MPTPHMPTLSVRRTLEKLGADIYDARKRRKLSAQVVADRAFTSRKTLHRIERGDFAVSIGIYASVLHALSLLDNLSGVADVRNDEIGLTLMSDAQKRDALARR